MVMVKSKGDTGRIAIWDEKYGIIDELKVFGNCLLMMDVNCLS